MKHLIALAIKYTIVATVTLSILTLFDVPVSTILAFTLILILPAYVVGDLYLYPRLGHFVAGIADFGLYSLGIAIFLLTIMDRTATIIQSTIFAAIFITFVEVIYHEFVITRIFKMKGASTPKRNQLEFMAEFADEEDISSAVKNNDEKTGHVSKKGEK